MRIRVRRVSSGKQLRGGTAVLVGGDTPIRSIEELQKWARSALFADAVDSPILCLEGGDIINSLDILQQDDVVLATPRIDALEQANQPSLGQDLQKALYGIHVGEQWAETVNKGVESRAIMSAFALAFSCTALMEIDETEFKHSALYYVFITALVCAVAVGFFALMVMIMTSAKVSRLIARKHFLFGDFSEDVENQLQQLHDMAPHWEGLATKAYLADRVTAVLTAGRRQADYKPQKPRTACGWLVEDYGFGHVTCIKVPPLTLVNMATHALTANIVLFIGAISCRIIDVSGPTTGAIYSGILLLSLLISYMLLYENGTFDEMDNIWNPKDKAWSRRYGHQSQTVERSKESDRRGPEVASMTKIYPA